MENLNKVYNMFEEIRTTSSTNAKKDIINKYKDDEDFIFYLEYLCNPHKITGISKSKMNKVLTYKQGDKFNSFKEVIEYILVNNTGKDSVISSVQNYINTNLPIITENYLYDFSKSLITKSYKLGTKDKLINSVIPNLIPEFNVMLAESYAKNINKVKNKKFILTMKLDGNRMILIKKGESIRFYTRQGKEVTDLVEIESIAKELKDGLYDAEVLAIGSYDDNKEQFTETMKRVRIKGVKTGLKLVCFDYIEDINDFYNGKCNEECIDRKLKLESIIKNINSEFIEYLKPLYIGGDESQIQVWSDYAKKHGEEGIMLNISDAPYSCKRTKDLLKVKTFLDADVKVVDVIEGDGKYKGMLGAITIEFEHNNTIYKCNCGTGFNDSERILYFNNKDLLLNKIVTISYFEISSNDNGGFGLRFPSWLGIIRDDKTEISMY